MLKPQKIHSSRVDIYLICKALVPNIRALSYFVKYGVVMRSVRSEGFELSLVVGPPPVITSSKMATDSPGASSKLTSSTA